jgi:ABC-type uncharacterized transport system auxiliary subunit
MICGNGNFGVRFAGRTQLPRLGSQVSTRNAGAVLLAALCTILLGACGAARPSKYYQLTVPGETTAGMVSDPTPITLLVGSLQASHLYREDRIVYSNGGTQMGTYETQRWTEPPTEMVVEVLLRELRATGRFQAVETHRSSSNGDFLLHGQLYDFKEISGGSVLARCTFDLELQELKTGRTVWTYYYTHDEPVAGKDVPAVVSALDKNVQVGVKGALTSLEQFFASHPAK